jgi:protein-S-isoprenylcysteine O-methyltransferase Ste14
MAVPALALALFALDGLLAVGLRMAVQLRRTGATGFKGMSRSSAPAERIGGLLFVSAVALCAAGPALQLAGAAKPLRALSGDGADAIGIALVCAGIAMTLFAQLAMGDDWRIGVDPGERTELVTHGPFALVRNPIYAAMIPSFLGLALLAANIVTLAGALLLIAALEVQTRLVEEPHLATVHGDVYADYAARVGRFAPALGRRRLEVAEAASTRSDRPRTDRA